MTVENRKPATARIAFTERSKYKPENSGGTESESGFVVCGQTVDGYDAIEKARILKPELIILDLSMPRMNGIETARMLKKMLRQTPIVMFTSYHAAMF